MTSQAVRRVERLGSHVIGTSDGNAGELVPFGFESPLFTSAASQAHLQWLYKKDCLAQDMFLIGDHGPLKRWLVLHYCAAHGREVEYIALTRDTTESDLKQRREIVAGGTAIYVDQSVVAAAVNGRVLIIEGLEKAERNVLPILNNLLENREMALEDGRFLVAPARFDALRRSGGHEQFAKLRLIKVHPRFRVIAIGIPAPPYPGNPLDPPLRSRFQARRVDGIEPPALVALIRRLYSNAPLDRVHAVIRFAETLRLSRNAQEAMAGVEMRNVAFQHLPLLAEPGILAAAGVLDLYPHESLRGLLHRVYPWTLAVQNDEAKSIVNVALESITADDVQDKVTHYTAKESARLTPSSSRFVFVDSTGLTTHLDLSTGASPIVLPSQEPFVCSVVTAMLQAHAAGRDVCVVGPKGEGKSYIVRAFAASLGHAPIETVFLYADMSARDLLQRRTTSEKGETVWQNTPLVTAVEQGRLAVLDGIHRLPQGVLSVIYRLIEDRELTLFDGTRYVRHDRFERMKVDLKLSDDDLRAKRILPVHPNFRLVATAHPPARIAPWLTGEMLPLFMFHSVDWISAGGSLASLLQKLVPETDPITLQALQTFAFKMRALQADPAIELADGFSLRQMIRVARRSVVSPRDIHASVFATCLLRFLPSEKRDAVLTALHDSGITPRETTATSAAIELTASQLRIGAVVIPISAPANPALVPDIVFFDIPRHTLHLEAMLQDFSLGEHLLLIGVQGVGKNKLADRLLQLMRREREYIQLHRDTTVQTLTLSPNLRDGIVIWEDSPLVRAMQFGRVLMVDEADKAPIEVVCVLKALLEDGEILLTDGRRFVTSRSGMYKDVVGGTLSSSHIFPVHPDFRLFALANPPNYPFLGNDFFHEMGDVFALHVVDNPDRDSEVGLLQSYAPNMDRKTLDRLSAAFGDLRSLVEQGLLSYPYSTRELVNVVKHAEKYPDDPIEVVLQNVFAFDSFDDDLKETLFEVFFRHGFAIGALMSGRLDAELAPETPLPLPVVRSTLRCDVRSNPIKCPISAATRLAPPSPLPVAGVLQLDRRIPARATKINEDKYSLGVPLEEGSTVLATARIGPSAVALLSMAPPVLHIVGIDGLPARCSVVDLSAWFHTSSLLALGAAGDGRMVVYAGLTGAGVIIDMKDELVYSFSAPLEFLKQYAATPPQIVTAGDLTFIYQVGGAGVLLLSWRSGGPTLQCLTVVTNQAMMAKISLQRLDIIDVNLLLVQDTFGSQFYIGLEPELNSCHYAYALLRMMAEEGKRGEASRYFVSPPLPQKLGPPSNLRAPVVGPEIFHVGCSGDIIAGYTTRGTCTAPGDPKNAAVPLSFTVFPRPDGWNALKPKKRGPKGPYSVSLRPTHRVSEWLHGAGVLATVLTGAEDVTMELVSFSQSSVRVVSVDSKYAPIFSKTEVGVQGRKVLAPGVGVLELAGGEVAVVQANGVIRVFEVRAAVLKRRVEAARSELGGRANFSDSLGDGMEGDGADGGQGDGQGGSGGKGQGGEGGEGSGGRGGSGGGGGRGDGAGKGVLEDMDFNQIGSAAAAPDNDVPTQDDDGLAKVLAEARSAARLASAKKLDTARNRVGLGEEAYARLFAAVAREVAQLRVILEGAEAKEKERIWIKNRTQGELDDNKIVDGATGDRAVFKRRGVPDPVFGAQQRRPKRIRFVMDVSSSMSRFNGSDRRLDRMVATTCMIMEAFHGFGHKYDYSIVGHDGESPLIPFVAFGAPPKNAKERLAIIEMMYWNAMYCMSGDHTLAAAQHAIGEVVREEADDYFVFVLSDANLSSYGISSKALASVLLSDARVHTYAVFIAGEGAANQLMNALPRGHGHVCLDTAQLPRLFKEVFVTSLIK